MGLTLATIGNRLRQARTNVGLTQEDAAAGIDMTRTALLQIESGSRNVSSTELYALANLYKIDIAVLMAEEDPSENAEESPLVALCRASPAFAEHQLKQQIERHLEIYKRGTELDRLLGNRVRATAPTYELPEPRNYADAIQQGEALAVQERKRLNLGAAPIPDIAEVIANQGIWASSSNDLPDEFSGLFMHHDSIGLAILINGGHQRGRRRFSYAHEYAHALIDRRRITVATITSKSNAHELVEKRANAFASEFLMPATGIEEVLNRFDKGGPSREIFWQWDHSLNQGEEVEKRNSPGSQAIGYQDVAFLAHEFAVSYDMAIYRLSDVGAINRNQIEDLRVKRKDAQELLELLKLFNPSQEDQPYLNQQIGHKSTDAYCRGLISVNELLELFETLDIDMSKARRVFVDTRKKRRTT